MRKYRRARNDPIDMTPVSEDQATRTAVSTGMLLTARVSVGTGTFAAAVVTVLAAVTGSLHAAPAVIAAAVLAGITIWAFRTPRDIEPLYQYAPSAPREAREHGRLTTAVVEERDTRRRRGGQQLVTSRLLVAEPGTRTYRTTTEARLPQESAPTHAADAVVAVRVHPEQRGVVVVVDDEPPVPPPARPSRPVPDYSGAPTPTRGVVATGWGATLRIGVPLVIGALTPLALVALLTG